MTIIVYVEERGKRRQYRPSDYHTDQEHFLTLLWYKYDENNDRDGISQKILVPYHRIIKVVT